MHPLICTRCAARIEPPELDESGAALVCSTCGHHQRLRRLPLMCVTGPSGTGKSTVARHLVDELRDDFVVLEQDVLWQAGLRDSGREHPVFRSAWLQLASMIHQNGRPVVLCGTVVPPEFEALPERVLFSEIHYLALTCEAETLAARLRNRPSWREWDESRIVETLEFAAWVAREAAAMSPPMTTLDTTSAPVAATAAAVVDWVRDRPSASRAR